MLVSDLSCLVDWVLHCGSNASLDLGLSILNPAILTHCSGRDTKNNDDRDGHHLLKLQRVRSCLHITLDVDSSISNHKHSERKHAENEQGGERKES